MQILKTARSAEKHAKARVGSAFMCVLPILLAIVILDITNGYAFWLDLLTI